MLYYYCLIGIGIISLITFLAYGLDKLKAQSHRFRIKEAVLLGLGFFGGSVGALLGMNLFRHKTRHWYFWAVNLLGLLWQAGLIWWLYQMGI